jgi:hypothetical protein
VPSTQTKKTVPPTPDFEAIQNQYIDGLKQANKTALDAVSSWVESMSKVSPKPQLFPATKEMRDAATAWFKFNGELLDLQREFALSFVQSVAPLAAEA